MLNSALVKMIFKEKFVINALFPLEFGENSALNVKTFPKLAF